VYENDSQSRSLSLIWLQWSIWVNMIQNGLIDI
jgi:hypothetical protein